MKIMSLSELRRNPGRVIDEAADDHEPVLITRDRGKPAAVLMSLEDFAAHEETAYLLRSPANAKRLMDGIAELEGGRGVERKLIE